jgi:hypothetical protein
LPAALPSFLPPRAVLLERPPFFTYSPTHALTFAPSCVLLINDLSKFAHDPRCPQQPDPPTAQPMPALVSEPHQARSLELAMATSSMPQGNPPKKRAPRKCKACKGTNTADTCKGGINRSYCTRKHPGQMKEAPNPRHFDTLMAKASRHYSGKKLNKTPTGVYFAPTNFFAPSVPHILMPDGSCTTNPRRGVRVLLSQLGVIRAHTPPNGYCGYLVLSRALGIPPWAVLQLLITLAESSPSQPPLWAAPNWNAELIARSNTARWADLGARASVALEYYQTNDPHLSWLPPRLTRSIATGALEPSNAPSALYSWCSLEAIRAVCRHVGLRILVIDERQVAQQFEDAGSSFVELIGGALPDMTCRLDDAALAMLQVGRGFECVVIQEDQHAHFLFLSP